MRQTESVRVAFQNVPAHESRKKFQGVTTLQMCFPNFQNGIQRYQGKVISGTVVVFRICHRGLKHAVAELLPTVQAEVVVEELLILLQFMNQMNERTIQYDRLHLNDVVNIPMVSSASTSCRLDGSTFYGHVFYIYLMYYYYVLLFLMI